MNQLKEIWQDIKGYEGHYQVSNKMRVKSFKLNKVTILKQREDSFGHKAVKLFKNKKGKVINIEMLISLSF